MVRKLSELWQGKGSKRLYRQWVESGDLPRRDLTYEDEAERVRVEGKGRMEKPPEQPKEDMSPRSREDAVVPEAMGIVARVVSQKGRCAAGHKVGDEFVIGQTAPPGMCSWAFYALFPFAQVLQFGGSFPWEADPDGTTVACPDPENPVWFELKRG